MLVSRRPDEDGRNSQCNGDDRAAREGPHRPRRICEGQQKGTFQPRRQWRASRRAIDPEDPQRAHHRVNRRSISPRCSACLTGLSFFSFCRLRIVQRTAGKVRACGKPNLELGFAIVKRQQKRAGLIIKAGLDVLQESLPDIQQFVQRDRLDCHPIEFLIEDMRDVGPIGLQQLVGRASGARLARKVRNSRSVSPL
ncbi:hypothetical protein RJJ37_24500 [Rhizobium redzepovicii]|uniref:Uncharacterized protein n=1 Tax=Rhizobium redzepovicii TaxID=2867518 RepID=A0AAW8PBN3_9HYPH|nr:hypothetical protein [Rhizobium redzepovicii]MDR9762763.1 hypothetical protein [Rhizobium redzepovicii]